MVGVRKKVVMIGLKVSWEEVRFEFFLKIF